MVSRAKRPRDKPAARPELTAHKSTSTLVDLLEVFTRFWVLSNVQTTVINVLQPVLGSIDINSWRYHCFGSALAIFSLSAGLLRTQRRQPSDHAEVYLDALSTSCLAVAVFAYKHLLKRNVLGVGSSQSISYYAAVLLLGMPVAQLQMRIIYKRLGNVVNAFS